MRSEGSPPEIFCAKFTASARELLPVGAGDERKGLGARRLDPHPLQRRKTQRVRHPQNQFEARLKSGVRRKAEPPASFIGSHFALVDFDLAQPYTGSWRGDLWRGDSSDHVACIAVRPPSARYARIWSGVVYAVDLVRYGWRDALGGGGSAGLSRVNLRDGVVGTEQSGLL